MREAGDADATSQDGGRRTLLVSGVRHGTPGRLGSEAYSYAFVYRAFAPLLARLGEVREIDRPESRLDYAANEARARGLRPVHLSFAPLHLTYLTTLAPNVVFPFWEFPDIPNEDLDLNPRHNWARIGGRAALILCASAFTRDAFRRAGVTVPIEVVPVPIRDAYFAVPAWRPRAGGTLEARALCLSGASTAPTSAPARPGLLGNALVRTHGTLQRALRARLPPSLDRGVGLLGQGLRRELARARRPLGVPVATSVPLDGVVYTTLLNPLDRRKNWQDLLSAFVLALRDAADATLVVKLAVESDTETRSVHAVLDYYRRLDVRHQCRIVLLSGYLSDDQLVELAHLSTYYVSAARAEGACLPLQDFLAAGRPAIAPSHTALADYVCPDLAFVVDSHPAPTFWPQDHSRRLRTTWHRLVWQSLHDQLRASYRVAVEQPERGADMAAHARARMRAFASAEAVWARLRAALAAVGG